MLNSYTSYVFDFYCASVFTQPLVLKISIRRNTACHMLHVLFSSQSTLFAERYFTPIKTLECEKRRYSENIMVKALKPKAMTRVIRYDSYPGALSAKLIASGIIP